MCDSVTLADLGEDDLIAAVMARYASPPPAVVVGPGDDAAVLDVVGPVVVATDTVVEGYDFRREWSSPRDVGVKVAAQNFADIAAMGARPLALLVTFAAPSDLPGSWATGLADGLEDECRRAGAFVVGGDVSEAAEIVVTGIALGFLDGPVVRRGGARPGDVVAVAGVLGASAAGLALLLAGRDAPAELVAAHCAPRPGYPAGPEAARAGARALIDTSDGLLRDAARLAVAADVLIDLDPNLLAPPETLRDAAQSLGTPNEAFDWVLTGGEDHAMLACFPPETALPPSYREIGHVVAVDGVHGQRAGVLVGGRPWSRRPGWTHFGGSC